MSGGWTDLGLTERGRQQARLLAERLKTELAGRPVRLLCSDFKRTVQTAEYIAAALGTVLEIEPGLRDYNNGEAAWKTQEQAAAMMAPRSGPFADWRPYPGSETWREFSERVLRFWQPFIRRPEWDEPDAPLPILVTHAGVIKVVTANWIGLPLDTETHFHSSLASLVVLSTSRWNEYTLERFNDQAHLYVAGLGKFTG